MMKRYFGYILSFIIILLAVAFTLYVNSTIKPNSELIEKIDELNYVGNSFDDEEFNYEIEQFNPDYEDIIAVKIQMEEHVLFLDGYRVSKAKTLEKYNDNDISDAFYIVENIFYYDVSNSFNIMDFGYLPMKESSKYIVLLNKEPYEDIHDQFDRPVYTIYGGYNKLFSKYNLKDAKLLDKDILKYSELDDYLTLYDESQLEKYENIKEDIFSNLNIN